MPHNVFVFGKEDIYTAMYMPADALQAIDISRSDFMRRKVLLAGTLYQYYTKGGYRSTCPAPGALRVPAFGRSGFLHQHVVVSCYIYFFFLACQL